ncbi:hypothetical protein [Micromonospora sp. NPDC005299]|uniref:hypothetical protein n=1 Tax=Micromonospora sp. NPDC005299 TaxID=3364231 RepID=UPI0036CDCA3C
MAFRTWGRLLLTALGVSVLAGAGQLGIAYGFGVVRLDGAFVDDSVNRWPAQLAWVGWFAAVATVAGAVLTERLARRGDASPVGTTELLSIAGVSGLGALVVAPLCMQPARAAELGGTVDPVWAVGICAILGAVIGAGAAIAVLLKPPFGWNIALTGTAVWLLALVSVAPSVASAGTLPTARLGVLEPSWLDPAAAQRLAMLLLPTLALLAGAAVGALARRAGYLPLVGGAAGAAGPALLAFAYLTAGPGTAADRYQLAPYYGALIAVVAGALGSTATTVLPRPVTTAAEPDAIEPTDILQPLPSSPAAPGPADPAPAAPVAVRPAGAPSPAHWDWPAAGGLTPAPVPAGLTRRPLGRPAPERPADRDEPTRVYGSGLAGEREASGTGAIRHRFDAAPFSVAGEATDLASEAHGADRPAAEPGSPARPGTADEITARHVASDLDGPAAVPVMAHEVASEGHRFDPPTPSAFSPEQGSDVARPDWPSDDTSLGQLPGSPPPGRRTSAIDVLAAGRPTPPAAPDPVTRRAPTAKPTHPAAPHAETTSATGRTEAPSVAPDLVSRPAPTAEPAAAHAKATRATGPAEAPSVAPDPVTRPAPRAEPAHPAQPEATRATGRTATQSVTPRPALDRTEAAAPVSAAEREVAEAAPAEPTTEAAPTRATRSKRSRASTPTPTPRPSDDAPQETRSAEDAPTKTRSADGTRSKSRSAKDVPQAGALGDALPTTRPVDDAPSADNPTLAGAPAAEPAAEAGEPTPAAPAPAGRAKRTRKPRTTRTAPGRAAAEPATTTSDGTAEPPATTAGTTAEPATTKPDSTSERAGSTPDNTSEPATAAPVATTAHTPSTGTDPAGAARAADVPEARPAPLADADPSGGSTPTVGERRSFFFDPAPAPTDLPEPPASPRPRNPMFEDVTPGNVRPAWPIAPAANWPVTPRGGAEPSAPGGPTAGRDADPDGTGTAGAARPEPAPRPRHRALPDLGRSTGWDALANARPAGPTAPPPTGRTPETIDTTGPVPETTGTTGRTPETTAPTGPVPETTGTTGRTPETTGTTGRTPETTDTTGRSPETAGSIPETTAPTGRAPETAGRSPIPETTAPIGQAPGTARAPEATGPVPETTGPILPAWEAQAPEAAGSASGGRHADVSGADATPEAAGGKSKARRSLFRRNRGKGGEPGEVDRDSEPLAAQDEEYVDWVAGLASDDNADDARSLRTGRHHRD